MGKKGGSKGLKRKPAPRFWPIHRKEFVWIVKPKPGPHSLESCLPLAIVLRELLGFAKNRKEAKTIVSQGKVHVDGKIRHEDDFPVGLMDVVFMPDINKAFRVLPSSKGLILHPVDKGGAAFKLCRIENKTVVKTGHVQLNLHDGSNILVKVADPRNPQEDVYETLDTLKVSLPEKRILEHIKMKKDALAIITGGKNIGRNGKIVEIEEVRGQKRRKKLGKIRDKEGEAYQTILDFVFAIGETHPSISLPEAM
ncbi:30S ribosomal protein S4e [Candidatus Bathyarchaeota archaeon]|nr:30S ribosomal protein S4e [Candidatus Bathyarchaeota archaeon]MCK4474210.1 30S ribosomal protein S4e [Candidatus Bathyarchaeota archaeon]